MTRGEAINWIINLTADIGKVEHRDLWHYEQALEEIRDMIEALPPAQHERIIGRWSGFYSEPNDDTHIYGEKLMEGDTVYLLGVEGYVSCECGAWGWGSPNYVPWEQLESRMPHNNAPTFCYCDNFISFWELKWNFDDGNDWDGVPYIKHCPNCGADNREEWNEPT